MRYLVVGGSGSPESIDPYMYGRNGRVITVGGLGRNDRQSFVAVVACVETGGFGLDAQQHRLESGLYFGAEAPSLEEGLRLLVNNALALGLDVPAVLLAMGGVDTRPGHWGA